MQRSNFSGLPLVCNMHCNQNLTRDFLKMGKFNQKPHYTQGLVKGEKFCFRNLDFYFQHGESTSRASQLTSPASQKSKDLNKVSLLLQDLGLQS